MPPRMMYIKARIGAKGYMRHLGVNSCSRIIKY